MKNKNGVYEFVVDGFFLLNPNAVKELAVKMKAILRKEKVAVFKLVGTDELCMKVADLLYKEGFMFGGTF